MGLMRNISHQRLACRLSKGKTAIMLILFDSEKHTEWDKDDNENIIRGTISYSGESVDKLRRMARFMKDTVVK